MSKTLGNVVDPIGTMQEFGTDALRFTLALGTAGQVCHFKHKMVDKLKSVLNHHHLMIHFHVMNRYTLKCSLYQSGIYLARVLREFCLFYNN